MSEPGEPQQALYQPASLILCCHFRSILVLALFVTAAPPLSATDAFASIIEGLCRHVAAQSVPWGRIVPRLVLLIYTRVRRIGHRFAVLAERVRAGTLRVSAPRSRSAASRRFRPRPALPETTAETESNAAQPPPERLPKDFAWLVRLAGSEAVCYGGQLAHLLRDPEMVALLAASPQIVRLLRPLCRALGVDPGLLPPRPRKAESPRCTPASHPCSHGD